ncbi:MAG TPA: tetratricopeptide repeat protein [Longimicrobiales bacterium]|nr:tetratricopeptide repeat protein [Longimicrobiales bacterium]
MIPRRLRSPGRPRGACRIGVLVLLVAVCALALPRGARAQAEFFERGNQLYQEGDYPAAIEAYRAVLEAGWESAALRYNLGNAHFKAGELGRAILEWERALALDPGDPDALANLELARSLTVDAVEPLPRFWLLSALDAWIHLLPRALLVGLVAAAWLAVTGGLIVRILARGAATAAWGRRTVIGGAAALVVLGGTLMVRELGLGQPDRGIILADAVPVRSAPSAEDDLTLFEVHEGTRVRIDRRAGDWAEVVLDDGKVGWVPADVFEEI